MRKEGPSGAGPVSSRKGEAGCNGQIGRDDLSEVTQLATLLGHRIFEFHHLLLQCKDLSVAFVYELRQISDGLSLLLESSLEMFGFIASHFSDLLYLFARFD